MDDIQQQLQRRLKKHGLELGELQLEQFELYYQELVSWNEKDESDWNYGSGASVYKTFL